MTTFIRLSFLAAVLMVAAGCGTSTGIDLNGDFCANAPKTVGNISISPTTLSLSPGSSRLVTPTVTSPTGATVTYCGPPVQWTTDNPTVATVEGSWTGANVTALAAGKAVVSMSQGGKIGSVQVTVTSPAVVGLKLSAE